MDPATIAALTAALVSMIQKAIEIHDAAMKGTITPDVALAQLGALATSRTSDEATNQAAALAEEAKRFPAEEVTPKP